MKKSIEAFNRSPWYLQVIIGLVGLAVAVALAIPLSWLVEILWGYVLQLITIIFKWISSWMPAGKLFSWKAVFDAVPKIVERLPLTLGLTIAGAFFGLILALVFAVVCELLAWDTNPCTTHVDLLWYSTLPSLFEW